MLTLASNAQTQPLPSPPQKADDQASEETYLDAIASPAIMQTFK